MTQRQRADFVFDALRKVIPRAETELEHVSAYELVVAVILSAQCTDRRVNMVTPALFEAYPTFETMAEAESGDVFPLIRSVTYPNNKSRHLVAMSRKVVDDFGGNLPDTLKGLMQLAGVGRESAQVVLSVVFNKPALAVDTHVFRVANRIGLVIDAGTPRAVERQLKKRIPSSQWGESHHLLILHGRYTCRARDPQCKACVAAPACLYSERLQRLPASRTDLESRSGRFYCETCKRYFDQPRSKHDRYGVDQIACRRCGSMNVFSSRSGHTTRTVPDFRVT